MSAGFLRVLNTLPGLMGAMVEAKTQHAVSSALVNHGLTAQQLDRVAAHLKEVLTRAHTHTLSFLEFLRVINRRK